MGQWTMRVCCPVAPQKGCRYATGPSAPRAMAADLPTLGALPNDWQGRWGIWEAAKAEIEESSAARACGSGPRYHFVRLGIAGEQVRGFFGSYGEAHVFHAEQLASRLGWPRVPITEEPERSPVWDHPEEFEAQKEYSFVEASSLQRPNSSCALSPEQLRQYDEHGFLVGIPVLDSSELASILQEFDELLHSRIDRAPSEEARFRAAHTISRPLHQDLVSRLARHVRVLAIVEAVLGPRFVCWSAHLFCKLPGDPTEQPWHQDAGFWPTTQSRAITLWIAFDDVDESNASVTFIQGSHRMGRLRWQPTDSKHHLLTSQIPDVDLLGQPVSVSLLAGEASVHCDLTVHGSRGNSSTKRRAGLALRYVGTDTRCIGPMINGYRMNAGCILPRGRASDPTGHWQALRRRPGGKRAPRYPVAPQPSCESDAPGGAVPGGTSLQ